MSNSATGFTIEYGNGTITVTDVSKPIWYGDYHKGKLALYVAVLDLNEETELSDTITMVAIFYDEHGRDFVMSTHYDSNNTIEDIVSDLQARVIIAFMQETSKQVPSIYVPGTDTLQ